MTTERITAAFTACRAARRAALVPFLMAGDPSPAHSGALLDAVIAAGADIIELGMPFSDPMADGAVIQQAGNRALAAGTTLTQVLAIASDCRRRHVNIPLILMGYSNPIAHMGFDAFADAAATAGVDGVLIVDAPIAGNDPLRVALRARNIAAIRLVAPTTSDTRIRTICDEAEGFVYAVNFAGTTGADKLAAAQVAQLVARIRPHTALPIVAGFGISEAAHVVALRDDVDGVVVGSALIRAIADHPTDAAATAAAFLAPLAAATQR